jgi:hypothetical protein
MASEILHLREQRDSLPGVALRQIRDRSAFTDRGRQPRPLGAALSGILEALPLWTWSMPVIAMALLFLVAGPAMPWFVGKYAWTGKDAQEILGPSLLGAAVCVAAFQCLLRTQVCRLWMLCIPTTFLCRELHFAGTGTGVYIGIVAIVWYGIANATRLRPVWNCHNVCGCLFGAACFYALAVTVDSGVWKFLPHSQMWSVNFEETMESVGHFLILAGSLCGVAIADRIRLDERISCV